MGKCASVNVQGEAEGVNSIDSHPIVYAHGRDEDGKVSSGKCTYTVLNVRTHCQMYVHSNKRTYILSNVRTQ